MTRIGLITSIVCAASLWGCGKSDSPRGEEGKGAEPASEPAAPDKVATEPAPSAGSGSLPPISLAAVSEKKRDEANRLNAAALEKQRAGDSEAAAVLYREALAADPGHILARYNLASAYALAKKDEEALKILGELKAVPDCAVCQGRLVRAKADKDFASLHASPAFKEITGAATVAKVSIKEAAQKAVASILESKGFPPALVHPRNAVAIKTTNGNCDPEPDEDCVTSSEISGLEEIQEMFDESFPVDVAVDRCTGECCSMKVKKDQEIGDVSMTIEKICFETDSAGVVTVKSIAMGEG